MQASKFTMTPYDMTYFSWAFHRSDFYMNNLFNPIVNGSRMISNPGPIHYAS